MAIDMASCVSMGSGAGLGAGAGGMGAGHGIRVDIGRGIDMEVSVSGDCTVEENKGRWMGTMVLNFRRMTLSLDIIEAWVTVKQS